MGRDALHTQTFRAKGKPPGGEHGSVHGVCRICVICATTHFGAVKIKKTRNEAASERVVETRALTTMPIPLQNKTPTAGFLTCE
jgi:hypothetical protein